MQVIDVRPSQGWLWIRDAWRYLRARPLGWLSLVGAWIILTFALLFIPYVGQLAANLLQPVFFAGFMIACRNQDNGTLPAVTDLFAAFRIRPANVRALRHVQRSGESGSPGAVGSTSASKSRNSVASRSVARLRPPPAFRVRVLGSASPDVSSRRPR